MQVENDLLVRCALLLPLANSRTVMESQDIVIDGGVIKAIRKAGSFDQKQFKTFIDAPRGLAVPGFVNAHTHSPAALSKGSFDRLDHPNFMWRNQADTANRNPEQIYVSTLLSALEMLKSGTTAVIDNFPEQNFGIEDVEAAVQAYRDIGMRASIALRIFDQDYTDIIPRDSSSLPQDLRDFLAASPLSPRPMAATLDLCEKAILRWHSKNEGLINIMLAPSAPLRCSESFLRGIGEMAEAYNTGVHTHLLETRLQVEISQEKYGSTLVAYLDSVGLLNERLSCAHCIWFSKDDIRMFAESGAMVVHNPVSNLRLGDGLAPIIDMVRSGVTVALGTDGFSTNDNGNLFEELKLAAILHRCSGHPKSEWISDEEALRMATHGGAAALLQKEKLGSLAVGKRADLAIYDLDAISFTPLNDPVSQLVFCENGHSVRTVIVDGRVVIADGHLAGMNEEDILERARRAGQEIKKTNTALYSFADRLNPYL
ncbi:amidohydrolase family protein [Treponema sp.]